MPVNVRLLRAAWLTLPLTAGAGANDAIRGFTDAPRVVSAVLLFASWGAGAVAVLAPRPVGLTLLRAVAPAYVLLAMVALGTGDIEGIEGWGALGAALITMVLASFAGIARAAANGIAYGDEDRFPLRVPPALFLGPLPAARVLVAGAVTAGPLLLADGEVVVGAVAVLIGIPVVLTGARALHGLSRRWLVLVPAGVVVVDPMTLAEPVLLLRSQVRALRAVPASARFQRGGLDLRLGATLGSVRIVLGEEVDLVRRTGRNRGGTTTRTTEVIVAVVQRDQLFARAVARNVRVDAD